MQDEQRELIDKVNSMAELLNNKYNEFEMRIVSIEQQVAEVIARESEQTKRDAESHAQIALVLEDIEKSLAKSKNELMSFTAETSRTYVDECNALINNKGEQISSSIMDMLSKSDAMSKELIEQKSQKLILEAQGSKKLSEQILNVVKGLDVKHEGLVQEMKELEHEHCEQRYKIDDSMKEILAYLLSLDEANRLIIAKLLLHDMEV